MIWQKMTEDQAIEMLREDCKEEELSDCCQAEVLEGGQCTCCGDNAFFKQNPCEK